MKKTLHILIAVIMTAACQNPAENRIDVVPYPNDVQIKAGRFNAADADIRFDASLDEQTMNAVRAFVGQISMTRGTECRLTEGRSGKGFIFRPDAELPEEHYRLTVSRNSVVAEASSLNGFIYAIQTIKQMLPVEVFGTEPAPDADWTMPCSVINDAPRFGYRGLHMDVSRHFFDMDVVKRYIDIMEVHKLNTLHWHLTDDQGWRIEIKKYPRLTEVGSIRNKTVIGHVSSSSEFDHTPYGEGMWFSQDQIKEIIAYAAGKGIEIIPEIDLPGHMLAALAAYPELGCTGGPYEVWGKWGVADDVLCAGKEQTMIFLENVLAEVAALFPSQYVHIGGDECPKVRWEECPECQAKIKELGLKDDERFDAEHYLQSYVMKRMTDFLESKGKKIIGWDEILEGEVAENATIMSWRGTQGGLEAAKMGHDAIMTPNTYFYIDYYQSLDRENEPLAIGGYLPIEKCYSYEPYADGMTDEEKAHILGVQANLWTEYIATPDHLFYMLLPRLAALAEVQWCEKENKNWDRFVDSADEFCSIYSTMGYNYATHIFDIKDSLKIDRNKVAVILKSQGDAPIRYTLDGSDPDNSSALYDGPVYVDGTCILKAVSERNGIRSRTLVREFKGHLAMGRPVTGHGTPHARYKFSYPDNLTDGIRGVADYGSGEWVGMYGQPLDVTIEMDENEKFSSVTLSTFIETGDYIFNPLYINVSVSNDGENFTDMARNEYPVLDRHTKGVKEYTVTFPETSARYLRVTAGTLEALPEWHHAKGSRGFLFADEIVVR